MESAPIADLPDDFEDLQRRILTGALKIPCPILFLDTETTGLHESDRIVSFGCITVNDIGQKPDGSLNLNMTTTHLICNPGRPSHRKAIEIHGHSDWELSHQQPFAEVAQRVFELLENSRLIVGHNIAFDLGFLRREFELVGMQMPVRPTACTMHLARKSGRFESARLGHLAERIGVSRSSDKHSALEDAWLAMQLYLSLEVSHTIRPVPFSAITDDSFENYQEFASDPILPLARKDLRDLVVSAKREGRHDEAIDLLKLEADWASTSSRLHGTYMSMWSFEQLAILYAKGRRFSDEIAILTQYCEHPSADASVKAHFEGRIARAKRRQGGGSGSA